MKGAQPLQTHREAIPTRYINELITIITENDFRMVQNDTKGMGHMERSSNRRMEENLESTQNGSDTAEAVPSAANRSGEAAGLGGRRHGNLP